MMTKSNTLRDCLTFNQDPCRISINCKEFLMSNIILKDQKTIPISSINFTYLSIEDILKRTNTTYYKVYNDILSGFLPAIKIAGKYRIAPVQAIKYQNSLVVESENMEQYISMKTIANIFQISPKSVKKIIKQNKINVIKNGRSKYILISAVELLYSNPIAS